MRHFAAFVGILAILFTINVQPTAAAVGPFESAVSAAAREFGVPRAVILAVSYNETRWVDHGALPSIANGFGIMHLQENPYNHTLTTAAGLLGVAPDVLKTNLAQNVRGGAAILRQAYQESFADDSALKNAADLNRWYLPVSKYQQSNAAQSLRNFADDAFTILVRGVTAQVGGETVVLLRASALKPLRGNLENVQNDFMVADRLRANRVPDATAAKNARPMAYHAQSGADVWVGTNNYTAGRASPYTPAVIEVVIHSCGGQIGGCISWMQQAGTQVSAHFAVRSSDGYRSQLVHREDTAWHATSHNAFSVGIEHEGWYYQSGWYNATLYRRSAWITVYTCVNQFGCDRSHVIGHSEMDPQKSDPGPYWDWNYYMTCVYELEQYYLYQVPPPSCF